MKDIKTIITRFGVDGSCDQNLEYLFLKKLEELKKAGYKSISNVILNESKALTEFNGKQMKRQVIVMGLPDHIQATP